MSPTPPYEMPASILEGDVDELGHVNNTVYLRWVQDVAIAHWRLIAPAESQTTLVWMVLRHEIDYQAPALPTDGIILRTWVGTAEGLRFDRHTEVLRESDRKVLAKAKTV